MFAAYGGLTEQMTALSRGGYQMARGKPKRRQIPDDEIEWREPPPMKSGAGTSWLRVLEPCCKYPNRWAMVKGFETLEQAQDAQSNLTQRLVKIPLPEDEWTFAARGAELFAIYRGRRPGQDD